jgi:hypothetical protein
MGGRQGYHLPNCIFTHITSLLWRLFERSPERSFAVGGIDRAARGRGLRARLAGLLSTSAAGVPLGFFSPARFGRAGNGRDGIRQPIALARPTVRLVRCITTSHVSPSHSAASWCRRLPIRTMCGGGVFFSWPRLSDDA